MKSLVVSAAAVTSLSRSPAVAVGMQGRANLVSHRAGCDQRYVIGLDPGQVAASLACVWLGSISAGRLEGLTSRVAAGRVLLDRVKRRPQSHGKADQCRDHEQPPALPHDAQRVDQHRRLAGPVGTSAHRVSAHRRQLYRQLRRPP